ncbi:MAG: amino acid permease [Bacteroides sp.]|nr:amino acid permease [Bacteroides sp.]
MSKRNKNQLADHSKKGNSEELSLLGFWGLTAIVFGSIIGSSIFNIAQNMARNASLGAVILAWLITGTGMLFLVLVFKRLSDSFPNLRAGIYQYAQVGFGNYIGFNMAWGYWLCVILGNVTYVAMLNESLASFFPVFQNNGFITVCFGGILIWSMFVLVSNGIKSAAFLNTMLSIIKFGCIILIIGLLIIYIKIGMFTADFWGKTALPSLGSIGNQLSSCMLVTVWSFMGIEGAVMMAGRTRRSKDIGKASVSGFLFALSLYILVTILCFGVMTQSQLANLPNPSLAFVLDYCAGSWAKWFVISSVVISLSGGFMAWTLVCSQVPYEAAQVGIFPRRFLRLNRHGVPYFGMITASIAMTLCLILVVSADNVYIAALNLTSLMVLPPYLFTALFLLKISFSSDSDKLKDNKWNNRVLAFFASLFCFYILFSSSWKLVMATSVFYLGGTVFYVMARRQARGVKSVFTPRQLVIFCLILICAIISIVMFATGNIQLDS